MKKQKEQKQHIEKNDDCIFYLLSSIHNNYLLKIVKTLKFYCINYYKQVKIKNIICHTIFLIIFWDIYCF